MSNHNLTSGEFLLDNLIRSVADEPQRRLDENIHNVFQQKQNK